jgi:hypothetical protein
MELRGCDASHAETLMTSWEDQGWSTRQCYRQLQEWLGERVLVDKTPSYALDGAVLRRAEEEFGGPLYVHLLRHPCGMIQSFEEVKLEQIFFRRDHPFTPARLAELVWLVSHRNILEFLGGVPAGRHCRVRFEDLVRQPEATLRGLCSFLGMDFEPAMAEPYRDKERRMTDGPHAESRMLGDVKFLQHRGIDAGVADRWAAHRAAESLGAPTRALAAVLGYPTAGQPPPTLPRTERPEETLARLGQLSDEEVEVLLAREWAEEGAADE